MTKNLPGRAVVVLFLVSAALSVFAIWWVDHQVRASGHDFCAIITAATRHPVRRPADPKANPSRENAYIFYEDFVQLGQRLGCG